MKTVKSKVCVYDCKNHKMEIVEKELPVFEPTPPQPSPIETVLYNICSLLKNKNITNEVIDEFLKFYENTYGKKATSDLLKAEKTISEELSKL